MTYCSRKYDLTDEVNATRLIAGFISCANDFVICTFDGRRETAGETLLLILASRLTKRSRTTPKTRITVWQLESLKHTEHSAVLVTEATKRNSVKAGAEDATLTMMGQNIEARTLSEHVEKMARVHIDSREVETSMPLKSDSIATARGFGASMREP